MDCMTTEQYLDHSVAGTQKLVWWIMENRREYFDRAKLVLNRGKTVAFLAESQSKQLMAWCKEENIQFKYTPSSVPVLGTDTGGTKEIVENNVTGLLHPIGRNGTTILSKNLQYLLKKRQRMGLDGRERVKTMYLKKHMYKQLWQVYYNSMKVK